MSLLGMYVSFRDREASVLVRLRGEYFDCVYVEHSVKSLV